MLEKKTVSQCVRVDWCKGWNAAIDEMERVKHGRWYKPTGMMPPEHHGRHRCTVCDHLALYFRIGHEELSPYCPNCGAKLDLEEK